MIFVGLAIGIAVFLLIAIVLIHFLIVTQDRALAEHQAHHARIVARKDEHIAFLQAHVPWADKAPPEVGATPPDVSERILH